ncbi:kinetochore-associated protein 1 isoform X2 [Nematostella vectensis]|uniref:kinetochore-associated protein 1 isoform X2 n=1 Tax=Nematostella vectensis TaxID=45351 RepID=UPI00207751A6|nr:kinetochore-associated protein 1 isoform X2 [Nematostella vectensis]
MSWDSVEVGLAGGEETVNFGPRNETGSPLYQVDTLASISPRGTVDVLPFFCGATSQDGFCFVVSKHVRLFNPSCTKLEASFTFEVEVDVVAWSDDSLFVVVGDRSGSIHFIHFPSKKIIFSEKLIQEIDESSTKSAVFLNVNFSQHNQDGSSKLVLLTASRKLFEFSNLKMDELNAAIESQDFGSMKHLHESMTIRCTDVSLAHEQDYVHGVVPFSFNGTSALATYGNGLCVWGQDPMQEESQYLALFEKLSSFILGSGILKVCQTSHGDFLVILDDRNILSLWDAESLTLVATWPHISVEDFLLISASDMESTGEGSDEDDKIVIMTKPADEKANQFLQILKLPSMTQVYSLQVANCRIPQAPSNQETIYFIEGILDRDEDSTALRIRCLTESLPENRLFRLLHKGKFDEAEKFARQFNLDEELVFKVKANSLFDTLSKSSGQGGESSLLQLQECLSKIKEDEYVVESCLQALAPTLEDTFNILSYARKRVLEKASPTLKSLSPSHCLLNKVLQVRDRLATFQKAYGVANFSGPRWHSFRSADLFNEVVKCFGYGEVHSAVTIWARHQSEFEASMGKLNALLMSIPQDLTSSLLLPWLRDDLVPFVLRRLPKGTDNLALWLEQRARNMEITEKSGWPKNALELASILEAPSVMVTKVAVKNEKSGSPLEQAVPMPSASSNGMTRLTLLICYLREVLDLHTKYNCPISLSDYSQETTRTLVFRLLDSVKATELIVPSMTKYIGPYMTHHGLDRDTVLLEYIKKLYVKVQGNYWSLSRLLPEARVLAVISCIKDKELYCQAALEVMANSVVPWSSAVDKLVQEVMAANPNNLYLKEQWRFVELRKVLSRYGMKGTAVPVASAAQRIVRIILSRDEPTVMEDALQVIKAYSHLSEYEVYMFRLQRLCREDRPAECLELLDSVQDQDAARYVDELLTYLCETLSEQHYPELDSETEHASAARTAITLMKYALKRDLPTLHDVKDTLPSLENILYLQKEFSEFFSLPMYDDDEGRIQLFQKYLDMYLLQPRSPERTKEQNNKGQTLTLTRLKRLCRLLKVSEEELMSHFAANLNINIHTSLDMCREMLECSPNPSIARVVFEVVHRIYDRITEGFVLALDENKNSSQLTRVLHQLLCVCTTCCDPGLLCDCMELCKCAGVMDELYLQCDTGEYGFSMNEQSSKSDPLRALIFSNKFKEEGLVLDSSLALPLAAKYTAATMYTAIPVNQDLTIDPIKRLSAAGIEILAYLQENNLQKLACKYANETLGTILQHYAANSYLLSEGISLPPHLESLKTQQQQYLPAVVRMTIELEGGLLVKVFNCKSIDKDLGLGYLCSIPRQLVMEKLTSKMMFRGQSYTKIKVLSQVGRVYAKFINDTKLEEACSALTRNALWGERLSAIKIYIQDVYNVNREEISQLLPKLIQDKSATVEMIKDFCRSFKVAEEEALLHYVKTLLLPTANPLPQAQKPRLGHTPGISKGAEYEAKVDEVVQFIPSQLLLQLLMEILPKVDQYDYTRLLYVLNLAKRSTTGDTATVDEAISLLGYLVHYERVAPPSKYEINFLHTSKSDEDKIPLSSTRPLSPLAQTRLPFHSLLYGDPWKVITPELSRETVPKLVGVAKILKLSVDKMYLAAIQNLFKAPVSKRRHSSDLPDTILDLPDPEPEQMVRFDFEEAQELLFAVKTKEISVAAARWVSEQLPLGEDKVKVLQACVGLANEWVASASPENSEKANLTYTRVLKLSRGVATQHVLHKYSIAEPALVAIVTQPAKLICQLYETRGARNKEELNQPPDIHKASDEIASINNSNVDKIRLYLLEQWLPASPTSTDLNESSDQLSIGEDDENSEDAMNLKRVIYLLHYTQTKSILFLLSSAFKQTPSANMTNLCRLRALRALFAIAADQAIEEVGKKSVASIKQYMRHLVFLAELEALHSAQTLSAFQKCNKEGLVRGVWRNHSHEKRGVRLVAELSLEYKIYDPQLWNTVLLQLLRFNMIRYLRHVLVSLAGVPDMWQLPCLPEVWRKVVLAPFENVSPPLSPDELSSCHDSAYLLQRCPLLLDLDIPPIATQFHRVGLHGHALSCLMMIPQTTLRNTCIKELLDQKCAGQILDQLLQQRILLRTDAVQEEVFMYIESTNQHELLVGSPHFKSFYKFLIQTDKLDALLPKIIQAGRLENAMQLVQLYHSVHPHSRSAKFVQLASGQLTPYEELLAFLEIKDLMNQVRSHLPEQEPRPDNEDEQSNELSTLEDHEGGQADPRQLSFDLSYVE